MCSACPCSACPSPYNIILHEVFANEIKWNKFAFWFFFSRLVSPCRLVSLSYEMTTDSECQMANKFVCLTINREILLAEPFRFLFLHLRFTLTSQRKREREKNNKNHIRCVPNFFFIETCFWSTSAVYFDHHRYCCCRHRHQFDRFTYNLIFVIIKSDHQWFIRISVKSRATVDDVARATSAGNCKFA